MMNRRSGLLLREPVIEQNALDEWIGPEMAVCQTCRDALTRKLLTPPVERCFSEPEAPLLSMDSDLQATDKLRWHFRPLLASNATHRQSGRRIRAKPRLLFESRSSAILASPVRAF